MALIVIIAVIIIDQAVKIWVKTHFSLGESVHVTDWFRIQFIENNGMAFGMELGSKLFLTLFRLILAVALVWFIIRIKDRPAVKTGFIVCMSLIVAGAIGNIIDCVFYGVVFPSEPGYDTLFHGRVVDMLYFPLFSFTWPDWVPWLGGDEFDFFPAIFNIADAAITVGMIMLLLFYSKYLTSSYSGGTVCPESEAQENAAPENEGKDEN